MTSLFTLEPSIPVRLDPQELREIAKAALNVDVENNSFEPLGKADLEVHIAAMERDIQEYAASGYFECAWDFAEVVPCFEHCQEVVSEFRKRHRGLMIITDSGPKFRVTVSWSPRKMG